MFLNLQRVKGIIRKEMLVLFGNPLMRVLLLAPAVLQLFIFGFAATLEVKNISFGVLDQDKGKWSQEIIQSIHASPSFIKMYSLENFEEGKKLMDSQKILFFIQFENSFSKNIINSIPATFAMHFDGRKSNASLIAGGYISEIVGKVSKDTPMEKNIQMPRIATNPIHWFNPNLEFPWFNIPALIGMISFVMSLIVAGLSVAREKELGTFDQILVSPATSVEIAIAKLVPGCIIALIHGTIFILGALYIFHVPLEGSLLLLYIAILLFALGASGIGMFISALVDTQQQAFLTCFTIAFPCILLSGFVTPIVNMPIFLQYISYINPLRYFIVLAHGIFLKDSSLPILLENMGLLAFIALLSIFFSINFFKKKV